MYWRSLLIVYLIFASAEPAHCQFIYYDHEDSSGLSKVKEIVEAGREIRDSLQQSGYHVQTFIIQEVGDKLWMTVDGRFDVYEWRENHWYNIYKGTYHGYNFNSQKFTYSGKLFSYKGYGFWRTHGEIIEFLPEKGEWEIIHASKDLPQGIGYLMDSVFYIHSKKCYEVKLLEQLVLPVSCKFNISQEISHRRVYNFRDYILIMTNLGDGSQLPLVEKESGDVYLSRRQPFKGLRDARLVNSLVHIWGNEVTIMFPDGSSLKYSIENEFQYYKKERESEGYIKSWIWPIVILSTVFIGLIFYRRRHSTEQPDLEIISAFKGYNGKLINSDTLDRILEIENISVHETRKYKRASIIREINTLSKANYGKALIEREKDPNDKRFYLYRIHSL